MVEHSVNLCSMLKVKVVQVSVEIIIIIIIGLVYTEDDLRDSCIIRGTAHTAGTALRKMILFLKQ